MSPESLYKEYTCGKQTLHQLSETHHISVSTIQRYFLRVHNKRIVSKDKGVVVLMDATYWGRKFGVLVFKDANRKKILWRKFLSKKETLFDYKEGVEWLEDNEFKIHGIVCDGLKGLPTMLSKYKVQLCQFHQVKTVKFYLTSKPELQASKELLHLVLQLCHTDKESFVGAFYEWMEKWKDFLKERSLEPKTGKTRYTHQRLHSAYLSIKRNMPLLWTFFDYPEIHLPNTNNAIEALFTDLKTKIRVHNGLSKRNRMKFIDQYFYNKQKSRSHFDH